jgi:hypothetical protein
MVQDNSKMDARWLKMAPRYGSKMAQDGPKMSSKGPQMAPEKFKTYSSWHQHGLRQDHVDQCRQVMSHLQEPNSPVDHYHPTVTASTQSSTDQTQRGSAALASALPSASGPPALRRIRNVFLEMLETTSTMESTYAIRMMISSAGTPHSDLKNIVCWMVLG